MVHPLVLAVRLGIVYPVGIGITVRVGVLFIDGVGGCCESTAGLTDGAEAEIETGVGTGAGCEGGIGYGGLKLIGGRGGGHGVWWGFSWLEARACRNRKS